MHRSANHVRRTIHKLQLNYSFSAQVRRSPLVLRTVFASQQIAKEQSAAFVLVSKLPDTNALDYGGYLTRVWSRRDNTFLQFFDCFDTIY